MKIEIKISNDNVDDFIRDIFPGANLSELNFLQKKQLIKSNYNEYTRNRVRSGMSNRLLLEIQASNEAAINTQLAKNTVEEVAE